MSLTDNSSNTFISAADISPEDAELLPFEIGKITEFNSKNKPPKAARGHWDYIKEDPEAYLNRFEKELDLEDVNIAGYFIVKELYRDEKKDIRTSITVHLIVQPKIFAKIKEHFKKNDFSFLSLPDNCGFSLPYLGTIHKSLNRLNLEHLINYFYIKNTISNEAFSNWISIPESVIKKYSEEAKHKNVESEEQATVEVEEEQGPTEDFNYMVFEEENTEKPQTPIPLPEFREMKKKEHKAKRKLFGKGRKSATSSKNTAKENPAKKIDSALFLCLSLFNFFSTSLLLSFLGESIKVIETSMMSFTVAAALGSLFMTMMFIRPSLKGSTERTTSILVYFLYLAAAGYQIFISSGYPGTINFIIPTSIAFISLVSGLIAAFSRISKMHEAELDETIKNTSSETPKTEAKEEGIIAPEKVIYPTITPFESSPPDIVETVSVAKTSISSFDDSELEKKMAELAAAAVPEVQTPVEPIDPVVPKKPKSAKKLKEKTSLLDALSTDDISETELLKMQLASKLKEGKKSRLARKNATSRSLRTEERKTKPSLKIKEKSTKNGVAKPVTDKSSNSPVKLSLQKKSNGLTRSPF